jgi:formiminoglutamate deiminase
MTAAPVRAWHAELAWLPGVGVLRDVLIEAVGDRFSKIEPGVRPAPARVTRLAGLTLPSLANAHSHAFHRALRGTASGSAGRGGFGSFWTWREQMYRVAARLDPDSYLALARATYAEMTLAGIGCVGEFHYLHHGPFGVPYADPNAMGRALVQAAHEAGLRITLLDTCYLSGGLDPTGASLPLAGPQVRFGDGTSAAWVKRVGQLGGDEHGLLDPAARVGAAIHSVRAVPPDQMHPVEAWTSRTGAPLHVHLSEQVAENEACLAAYRCTPAALLYDAGVLGPRTTVVHATHLTSADLRLLGGSEVFACVCPTTEADLADGIGPFGALAEAGCRLTVGSDSQAVIDLFEETRRIEQYQRLASSRRGTFGPEALGCAMTWDGHASLGWPDAGEIAPGSLADLVTLSAESPRLAGLAELISSGRLTARPDAPDWPDLSEWPDDGPDLRVLEAAIFSATAADVRNVVIGGRDVVVDGRHVLIDDVTAALAAAIREVIAGD